MRQLITMTNITLPTPPQLIKKEGNLGVFEINDIYPGYGITIANALRRVILSSLPGAAITAVKIKNVAHEFSTITNVKEDVMEIILNLKQVRFKFYGDEPIKLNLSVKGDKKVTARDIQLNGQAEVINTDAFIATLTTKNAELDMELTVEKGMEYVIPEAQGKEKKELGLIFVDAVFSPIRKVGYTVENIRVGQRTDFNKIILEIETDASITPEEALDSSIDILIDQFSAIKKLKTTLLDEKKEKPEIVQQEINDKFSEQDTITSLESVLLKSVNDLKISKRTLMALKENKLKTVGAIIKKTENTLLEMPKMGKTAVKEVKKELGKLGLTLKE